jgi:hypothetical protein
MHVNLSVPYTASSDPQRIEAIPDDTCMQTPITFRSRVTLITASGQRVKEVGRDVANDMVLSGQVIAESAKVIRLTDFACFTSEMSRGSIHGVRSRRADSSSGDAGRGWARSGHTLHFAVGRTDAGLRPTQKSGDVR